MAAISGTTGDVALVGGVVTNVHQWEAEDTTEVLEISTFTTAAAVAYRVDADNIYRATMNGLKQWTGSYTCYIDDGASPPVSGTAGQATLTSDAGNTWVGNVRVQSTRPSVSVDGSQRVFVVSFTGNGIIT